MNHAATRLPDLAQSDLVRRYVRGELDAAETTVFELDLLRSIDLQDEVEAELLLRDRAMAMPPAETTRPAASTRSRWLAVAASFLAAGFGAGFLARPSATGSGPQVPVGQFVLVSFSAVRGAPTVDFVAPGGTPIAARFLVASDLPYGLLVQDRNGVQRVQLDGLLADANGYLQVLLPAFQADDAPLRLSLSNPESSQEFGLRVLP